MARRQLGVTPVLDDDDVTKAYVEGLLAGIGAGGGGYYAALVGNGSSTSLTVTHSLGTRDVVISVYDASTYEEVNCDKFKTTTNTVTLVFASAPASNAYRCVVVGAAAAGSGSGNVRSVVSVTSAVTLGATAGTDYVALISSSGSATLPTAASNTNLYTCKNVDSTVSTTVLTTSSQTIDGSTSIVISPNASLALISDGANWRVISSRVLDDWQDAWSSVTAYKAGAIVQQLGSTYIAVGASTNVNPYQDLTTTVAASASGATQGFGSQNSLGVEFQVDEDIVCGAMDVSNVFAGAPTGSVGIASAINVSGVGTQWIQQGDPSSGTVTFSTPVSLTANVSYWFVVDGVSFNMNIVAYASLTHTHMSFPGGLAYGNGGNIPTHLDGYYGVALRLFGAVPGVWELLAARGAPGANSTVAGPPGTPIDPLPYVIAMG